ncbi:MAG: hypothetical protein K2N05_10095 [Muribaculaceae bacterium]|nr:hypothetical protein [Muribaculaceae bacterium]
METALKGFESILEKIYSYYNYFDFCFFPVDSRIGTDYFTGAKMFLGKIPVGTFFPMHYELGNDQDTIDRLHRDAAAFELYASPMCHQYIMSSPYSVFTKI